MEQDNTNVIEQVRRILPRKVYTTSSYFNREFATEIYTKTSEDTFTRQWRKENG